MERMMGLYLHLGARSAPPSPPTPEPGPVPKARYAVAAVRPPTHVGHREGAVKKEDEKEEVEGPNELMARMYKLYAEIAARKGRDDGMLSQVVQLNREARFRRLSKEERMRRTELLEEMNKLSIREKARFQVRAPSRLL